SGLIDKRPRTSGERHGTRVSERLLQHVRVPLRRIIPTQLVKQDLVELNVRTGPVQQLLRDGHLTGRGDKPTGNEPGSRIGFLNAAALNGLLRNRSGTGDRGDIHRHAVRRQRTLVHRVGERATSLTVRRVILLIKNRNHERRAATTRRRRRSATAGRDTGTNLSLLRLKRSPTALTHLVQVAVSLNPAVLANILHAAKLNHRLPATLRIVRNLALNLMRPVRHTLSSARRRAAPHRAGAKTNQIGEKRVLAGRVDAVLHRLVHNLRVRLVVVGTRDQLTSLLVETTAQLAPRLILNLLVKVINFLEKGV